MSFSHGNENRHCHTSLEHHVDVRPQIHLPQHRINAGRRVHQIEGVHQMPPPWMCLHSLALAACGTDLRVRAIVAMANSTLLHVSITSTSMACTLPPYHLRRERSRTVHSTRASMVSSFRCVKLRSFTVKFLEDYIINFEQ